MYFLDELVDMIEEYALLGFPLTPKEIRSIAYDFAVDNDIIGFSDRKEIAGHKWFSLFLKHHDSLRVKQGVTNLSLACALGSSSQIIDQWFDKYEQLIEELQITDPKYIWNVDEHGSEDIPKVKKVVGIKKIKTFQVVCHEKARRTTMLTYINGEGFALPPMVIQRGKYDSWRIGVPPGSLLGGLKRIYQQAIIC